MSKPTPPPPFPELPPTEKFKVSSQEPYIDELALKHMGDTGWNGNVEATVYKNFNKALEAYITKREDAAQLKATDYAITKLKAYINGTATYPAADALIDLIDHRATLKAKQ